MSALARLEHALAYALMRLPAKAQYRLSGRPPITVDGDTLHPQVQLLLAVRERLGPIKLTPDTVAKARVRARRDALAHAGRPVPLAAVREISVDGGDGPLKARHYVPLQTAGAPPAPLLLFFHGGGYVIGDLDTHDAACRTLAYDGQLHVVAVDYRLSPENPYPAAIEDAWAAFMWAVRSAEDLGADPARIAVGGDSAGANLATVVAQLAARRGAPAPVLQVLIYPAADLSVPRPSMTHFADGFFLTKADIELYAKLYGGDMYDPLVSPLLATDLTGVAPAFVVTAGFDPLRDEGEEYAAALEKAGTPVTLRRVRGLVHGFINMAGVSPACRDELISIAKTTSDLLSGVVT